MNGNSQTVTSGVEAKPGKTSIARAPATQSSTSRTGSPHQSLAPMRKPPFTAGPDSLLARTHSWKVPKVGLLVFGLAFIVVAKKAPKNTATQTHVIHMATNRACE